VVVGADGVEGAVAGSTAPLPSRDAAEGPTAYVAVTIAKTLNPTKRLYGSACKTEMGTVQLTALPLQPVCVMYVAPSLDRIDTVYSVIAEPPSVGATQFIITLLPETVVVRLAWN
jgi:hypothetical protein